MFLDFDGSLSLIVARPELAQPFPGVREAVAALVQRYRLVAVVSGRRAEEVAGLLGVGGVRYVGLYGMQDEAPPELPDVGALLPSVRRAAAAVPGAWVESKGVSAAVHYRQAADPAGARTQLLRRLSPLASEGRFELVEGKRVVELVPAGRAHKGDAVERLARELDLRAALYAGDDVADRDAFAALDRLAAGGVEAVKVAVRGRETPKELLAEADLIVEGPAGLAGLLHQLE